MYTWHTTLEIHSANNPVLSHYNMYKQKYLTIFLSKEWLYEDKTKSNAKSYNIHWQYIQQDFEEVALLQILLFQIIVNFYITDE